MGSSSWVDLNTGWLDANDGVPSINIQACEFNRFSLPDSAACFFSTACSARSEKNLNSPISFIWLF
jgi:hypothetical protein